jgi:hypothetical protein
MLSCTGLYWMRYSPVARTVRSYIEPLMFSDVPFHWPNTSLLIRQYYTGVAAIDRGLRVEVIGYLPGAGAGFSAEARAQQMSFLGQMGGLVGVMSIEAARAGWGVIAL